MKQSRRRIRNRSKILFSMIFCALLGVSAFFGNTLSAFAQGTDANPTADASTADTYTKYLGNNSTENNGMVWVDKTVTANSDNTFDVTFSALSSTQTISTETTAPIDVVFVLDFSASMTWGTNSTKVSNPDGSDSRIKYLIDSLNSSIDTLVKANDNNRIAVVTFNRTGKVFMNFTDAADIKKNVTDGKYFEIKTFEYRVDNNGQRNGDGFAVVENNIDVNGESHFTDSKTNIQSGLNEALHLFESVDDDDTTVTIDGQEVTRIPNLVLMSDGAPTTISLGNWQGTLDTNTSDITIRTEQNTYRYTVKDSVGWGDNDNPWCANGVLPMLTAAYMKDKISEKYFPDGSDTMDIYTIGFSTNYQDEDMVEMANLVLNPKDNLKVAANSSFEEVRDVYEVSTGSRNQLHYVDASYSNKDTQGPNGDDPQPDEDDIKTYNLGNSASGLSLAYNTAYYAANNADDLNDAFDNIVNSMTHASGNPTNGSITYTDPIGEYMEVKSIDGLYIGETKIAETTLNADGSISFDSTFAGLSGSVKTESEKQVLTLTIPEDLLPLIENAVTIDSNGAVTVNTTSNSPLRLKYTVGLTSDALNSNNEVDEEHVSEIYIQNHTDSDGNVLFYSNYFDANNQGAGAHVTFTPASTNPYYFFQEDTLLYTDEACTIPATSIAEEEQTYFYKDVYYSNDGESFKAGSITRDPSTMQVVDDQVYVVSGTAKPVDSTVAKDSNTTSTSANVSETKKDNGNVVIYLGNNGVLSVPRTPKTGSLKISKEVVVDADSNLTVPTGKEFTFTVSLKDSSGNDLTGEYSFEGTSDGTDTYSGTVSNGGTITLEHNGSVTITGLPQGAKYTVKETPETGYASTSDGSNGTISETTSEAKFTNKYTPVATTANISVNKAMDGRTMNDDDIGKYTFTITAKDGGKPPASTTAVNGTNGVVNFGSILYDRVGTFTYEITETDIDSSVEGVSKSNEVITVTVVVSDNPSTGQLSTSVSYSGDNGTGDNTITNTYSADPVTINAITGIKTVTSSTGNSYSMVGGEFKFTVTPSDSNPESDPVKGGDVYNNAEGNIPLIGAVEYTEAGEYTYTISETSTTAAGMTLDGSKYVVRVKISDDGTGQLKADVSYTKDGSAVKGVQFENKYDPKTTSVNLGGTKKLTGKDLTNNEFTFVLAEQNADGTYTDLESVTNTRSAFSFTTITYTQPGTHVYRITEADTNEAGITYDTTEYPVTVTVTDEGGELKATQSVENSAIVFNNSYKPASTVGTINAHKDLTGKDLAKDEFTFELLENNEVIQEAANDADGNIKFNITYTEKGTYNYSIREKTGSNNGISYDDTLYTVQVVVEDNGGALGITSISYFKDNQSVSGAVFTNTYQAKPVDVVFYARKFLEGKDLSDGQFTFRMEDESGELISEATNNANGDVAFDTLTFDEAGTYTYTVYEVNDGQDHVTYDETVYTITVEVTDNLNGALNAAVSIDGETNKTLSFTNKYEEPKDPTDPGNTGGSDTSTNMHIGLFASLMVVASSLMGLLFIGKKRNNR